MLVRQSRLEYGELVGVKLDLPFQLETLLFGQVYHDMALISLHVDSFEKFHEIVELGLHTNRLLRIILHLEDKTVKLFFGWFWMIEQMINTEDSI